MDNLKKQTGVDAAAAPEIKPAPKKNLQGLLTGLGIILLALVVLALYFTERLGLPRVPLYAWPIVGVAVLIILIGTIFVIFSLTGRVKPREPDYRAFFDMGLVWIALGLPLKNPALWIMGLVFLAVGLKNKKKWKDRAGWKDLPRAQRNLKLALLIVLGLMVILGFVSWYLNGGK